MTPSRVAPSPSAPTRRPKDRARRAQRIGTTAWPRIAQQKKVTIGLQANDDVLRPDDAPQKCSRLQLNGAHELVFAPVLDFDVDHHRHERVTLARPSHLEGDDVVGDAVPGQTGLAVTHAGQMVVFVRHAAKLVR